MNANDFSRMTVVATVRTPTKLFFVGTDRRRTAIISASAKRPGGPYAVLAEPKASTQAKAVAAALRSLAMHYQRELALADPSTISVRCLRCGEHRPFTGKVAVRRRAGKAVFTMKCPECGHDLTRAI